MLNILITIVGLTLLLSGGEALVRGAVGIARWTNISPFIVGLTIVGFGTSAPELVVSVNAVLMNSPGISVGNIIGSNMANMLLIVGAAAVLSPLSVHRDALRRDSLVMALATVAFVAVAFNGSVPRLYGGAMIGVMFIYLGYSLWSDKHHAGPTATLHKEKAKEIAVVIPQQPLILIISVIVGLFALIGGARLVVDGATALALEAGMSDEVIGITLIAISTSLPEITTALIAAKRGHADVCIGNVIGSNIFNLLGITGAAAITAPLTFEQNIIVTDLWALLVVTAIFVIFMITGRIVQRWEGATLLSFYLFYVIHHSIF